MKRKGITTIEAANAFLKSYIAYYNRKFAVQAANPEKAYLPSREEAILQTILAKQAPRKLDSGLSFSFCGRRYTLPTEHMGRKIPASPHDTVTVATSSHIGMQVIFKGLVFQPVPLRDLPKASLVQDSSICKKVAPKNFLQPAPVHGQKPHPWRRFSSFFYSDAKRDDILPDQLSAI